MSPSIWGLVLFVFNSSLWEQWGHWEGLLWTDVGFVLTFLAAGSSCEAPGKASLGINSWEVLFTSTALPDSPPHTTRFSQNFCARCWSLWCSWLVTGSKDIFHHVSTAQSLPHFDRSSHIPHPFHCWSTRNCVAQNDARDQKMRGFHLPGDLCSDHGNLAWGIQGDPQILNSSHYWRRCIPRALAKWWIVLGNSLSLSTPTERSWISDSGSVAAIRWTILQWMSSHGSGKCHIPIISKNGASLHPNGKRWTYFSFISPNSPSLSAPSPPPAKFSVEIRQTKIERSGLQIIFFQFCCLIPVTNRLYLGKRKKANSCLTILVSISHLKNITSMEKEQK